MNFLGMVAKVGKWVVGAGAVVRRVFDKAQDWADTVNRVSDAYLQGREVAVTDVRKTKRPRDTDEEPDRPDLFVPRDSEDRRQLDHLVVEISGNRKALERYQNENDLEHERMHLATDIIELVIASQSVERHASNIRLHVSNLNSNFESLRNMMGLLDFTNRQNVGVRATIKQLNQVIYHLQRASVIPLESVQQIRDIDLDPKPGAISISAQFQAFEKTRDLLERECDDFIRCLSGHKKRAESVREMALKVPDKAKDVLKWLDAKVLPSLEEAHRLTTELKNGVVSIPALESGTGNQIRKLSSEDFHVDFGDDGK